MPLIDGTYEILRQRTLSETEMLVLATDPAGGPVRIVLYEVAPEHEASFERHRRILRRLGREDDVLLRDVVSRPGAHFAVWEDPGDAPPAEDEGDWPARLEALGVDPADAELRGNGRAPVLAGLRWDTTATRRPGAPHAAGGSAAAASRAAGAADPLGGQRHGRGGPGAAPRPRLPWNRIELDTRSRTYLVAALLTLAASGLALVGWERGDNDSIVTIPAVEGVPAQEAADRLAELGLTVVPQARASADAAGSALATVPPAGAALRPGREVQLVYGLPPDGMATQEVPDLLGRSLGDDLNGRLRDAGLALASVARVPAALPVDTVLSQRPAPRSRLGRGGGVSVVVSDGPRPATTFLPDLVGLSVADARALALVAGLPAERVRVDVVADEDAEPGTVVAMTPAPWHGLRVEDVTLRLLASAPSPGTTEAPATGTTPDLVGLDTASALEAARSDGLDPAVARMSDPRLPAGVVLQDPAPGAEATGSVRLVVNVRPVTLPVPTPVAEILEPRLRDVPYRFLIEPGIPERTAEVRAVTVDGTDVLVRRTRTSGGSVIEGEWATTVPGPVRFEVYLNGLFYADVRVSP